MSLLVKLFAFLLMLILLRMFLSWVFGTAPRRRSPIQAHTAGKTIRGKMVKDPQCGMYIATDIAIAARSGGETFFFCSDACREAFLKSQKIRR